MSDATVQLSKRERRLMMIAVNRPLERNDKTAATIIKFQAEGLLDENLTATEKGRMVLRASMQEDDDDDGDYQPAPVPARYQHGGKYSRSSPGVDPRQQSSGSHEGYPRPNRSAPRNY